MTDLFDLGVLWIEDGTLCINVPRLLAYAGLPDTEENRDLAVKGCIKVMRELRPDLPMLVIRLPSSGDPLIEEVNWHGQIN